MVQARINLALVGQKKQAAQRASLDLMLLISDLSIQILGCLCNSLAKVLNFIHYFSISYNCKNIHESSTIPLSVT